MDFARADVDLRERLPRDLMRLTRAAVWILALCELWAISTILVRRAPLIGVDARAYWLAWRRTMYLAGPNTDTAAYLYSPAFAQLTWPLTMIPWFWVFAALWSTGNAALLVWMLRPLGWAWAVPLALLLFDEVLNGNIFIPLAAMCVLGFRYPGVWAFSALTKVAPTVMPVWWLARREWRPLVSWAVTTLAVVVVSAAVAPDLWKQWVAHMAQWAAESGATIGSR